MKWLCVGFDWDGRMEMIVFANRYTGLLEKRKLIYEPIEDEL